MEHSYETGVNKKMVFFRMLHSDFSRMIKSWKFYLAIAFIAVLTFLSIYLSLDILNEFNSVFSSTLNFW